MKKIMILLISIVSIFNVAMPVEAYSLLDVKENVEERRATTYTKHTLQILDMYMIISFLILNHMIYGRVV